MVQILPQKTNVGSQIGQALGMGLGQGSSKAFEQNYQAGKLQEAFSKLKGLTDPAQIAQVLGESSIYSPNADRTMAALAPLLLNRARTSELYGQNERGGAPPMAPADASRQAVQFAQGAEPAGFLAPPMNPEQIQDYATRYAQVIGDPNAFDAGLQQAAKINAAREQSRNAFEEQAVGMGVKREDIPRYMQSLTEFQYEKDPAKINRLGVQKYKRIENLKDSLKNLTVPGIGTTAVESLKGGLIHALTSKGNVRQNYLKKYDDLVGNLVNEGEEPFVRESLASIGLSPTEVEERIHPLTQEKEKALAALPSGNKMNPQARQESLINFFRNNVDANTSLSVLRDHLWKDKNYDWEEIANAISIAFPKGANLTQYQNAEIPTITSPPKQSLMDLLGPGGDIRGFFRGQK